MQDAARTQTDPFRKTFVDPSQSSGAGQETKVDSNPTPARPEQRADRALDAAGDRPFGDLGKELADAAREKARTEQMQSVLSRLFGDDGKSITAHYESTRTDRPPRLGGMLWSIKKAFGRLEPVQISIATSEPIKNAGGQLTSGLKLVGGDVKVFATGTTVQKVGSYTITHRFYGGETTIVPTAQNLLSLGFDPAKILATIDDQVAFIRAKNRA